MIKTLFVTVVFTFLSFNVYAGNRYTVDQPYYYIDPVGGPKRISTVWEERDDKIIVENMSIRMSHKKSEIRLIRIVDVDEANAIYNKQTARWRSIDRKKVKFKKELDRCHNTREQCLDNRPRLPISHDRDINGDPFKCGVVYESVGVGPNQKIRPLSKEEVEARKRSGSWGKPGRPRYTMEDIKRKQDYIKACEDNYKQCKAVYGLGKYDY